MMQVQGGSALRRVATRVRASEGSLLWPQHSPGDSPRSLTGITCLLHG